MTTSPGSGTTASASRGSEDLGLDGRVSSVNSARQAVGPAAAAVLAAAAAAAAAQQPRTPDQKHQQHQLPAGAGVERSSGSGTTLDGNGVIKRSKEQEKNRRAQARFRERQKAKNGETERRMRELEEAVKDLQVERDALAVKAETLERCLLQGDGGDAAGSGDAAGQEANKGPTWSDYVQWYKGYVQQLAPLLVQAQFDSKSEAGKKIVDLWVVIVKEGIKFYRDEPLRAKVYSQPILSDGEPQPPRPDKALWRQVTAALQLTDAQMQHCQAVRTSYMGAMAGIMAQRQALNAVMQDMPDCDANAKVALHTAQAQDAIQRLQANLKQEQVLQSELSVEVFQRLLTPIQAATAMVGLHPWIPDKLHCACAVNVRELRHMVGRL